MGREWVSVLGGRCVCEWVAVLLGGRCWVGTNYITNRDLVYSKSLKILTDNLKKCEDSESDLVEGIF